MSETDESPGSRSHAAHVASRFGARAAAYVASGVHAGGEDLAALADLARAAAPGRVLDLGCGGGHVAYAAAPFARRVTAYDLSQEMLDAVSAQAARRGLAGIETRQGSAERLPFADGAFDLVLSRYSAHHWADVPAALAEARRVLAPGGRIGLVDAVAPEAPILDTHLQAWELLRDPSHGRDYRVCEWRAMLAAAGFVPGPTRCWRVRMDFPEWIARMATPESQAAAIRALQASAPEPVTRHFGVEADGSFQLDVMMIEGSPDGVP